MYVQSRLESGKDSSDKPKPTVSKPKDTTEPDTTETRLETVVEEDETPQPPPKVDIIPKNLEIKTKKVVSGGMVAKGIKRRKKKVVHQSSGGDDLQMEVRPLE